MASPPSVHTPQTRNGFSQNEGESGRRASSISIRVGDPSRCPMFATVINEKRGEMAIKQVRLGLKSYRVVGHSEDDPYFSGISDGFENGFFRFLVKNCRRDSVALDVGANIGIVSLILAQVLDEGEVLAFEPGIQNFDLLQKNLNANGVSNVRAVNTALSDTIGEGRFSEDSAYGGMVGGYRPEAEDVYEVELSTIDAVVSESGLRDVDLIKIDVEGHETAVLAGAVETIKRHNPAIYIEFNAWALMAYGLEDPREFVESLIANFDSVSVVDPVTGDLSPVEAPNLPEFLHTLLIDRSCVADLVLVSDASRPRKSESLKSGLAEYVMEIAESAIAERDIAFAQRDQALAERDAALAEGERLVAQHLEVTAERDAAAAGRDVALSERDVAVQRYDEVAAERDQLLASTSWRITAPLRQLARSFRGR